MQKNKKRKVVNILIVLIVFILLFSLIFLVLKLTGLWEQLNSVSKLQQAILSLGFWGRSAFVFIQFLQVTLIPVPSPIVVGAGALIYGPFQASLLSLAGILLGSAFAFFLGRVVGTKLVVFMVGEKTCEKWKIFLNKCKYTFVLMMLLPCFPDDILCLVAGLTDMSWLFFMTSQFIARPIGVFLVSYFSSGQIIPYHGWGIYAWIIIAIGSIVLIYLSSKYNYKIENAINRLFHKKSS